MGAQYRTVLWNRQKKIYDLSLAAGIVLYLGLFVGLGFVVRPQATAETLIIRALGSGALLSLHVVLSIGPLARLDRRFLPLLYNRRHLGVATFLLAAGHAGFSLFQFHAVGDMHPIVSVLVSNPRFDSLSQFPFQPLGLLALVILFLMAATSHDFWLANLTAPVWKALHMSVYVAYAALILHVALGVLQAETDPVLAGLLSLGLVWIVGIHLTSGWRERRGDLPLGTLEQDGYVPVCSPDEIAENRARIVCLSDERIAIFKYDGKISAVSNACQHQNGPLGEGRVIDGCITCPWHGYQYAPESGASPPPFTEKVPTFNVKVADGRIWIDPRPNAAGTRVEPAQIVPIAGPTDE
jgi:nitrite reductase/ring-hydroxylating ferredoxin subunit/DMSO/TMAO reductase YedYZ heme-binding membrane subunit